MRLTVPITAGVAIILAAYACGNNPPPPPPPPPVNQDSIDSALAAQRARAQFVQDSIRRAREEAERLQRAREDSLARVRRETERVRNALETMVHFDFDRSNIRDEDMGSLDLKVAILQANPMLRIAIGGHCDERGSDEYNLALGNRRALAAKQYLIDRGIAEDRITTSSFGEERPIDGGHTEEAWARNRRDEFSITAGGSELHMPSGR